MKTLSKIKPVFVARGMSVDKGRAFSKLSSKQFTEPARGLAELVQNSTDSYSDDIAIEDRIVNINYDPYSLSVRDYGRGMNLKRLELCYTLGGSDKHGTNSTGKFGLGFVSIFNPELKVEWVRITTNCESSLVEMFIPVKNDGSIPQPFYRLLEENTRFYGTLTQVKFSGTGVSKRAEEIIRERYKYYPGIININSARIQNGWTNYKVTKGYRYQMEECVFCPVYLKLLYKYEFVKNGNIYSSFDIRYKGSLPYVKGYDLVLNAFQDLDLTISRDNVIYNEKLKPLNKVIFSILDIYSRKYLKNIVLTDDYKLILYTNLYSFTQEIKEVLIEKITANNKRLRYALFLAKLEVFKLSNKKNLVSLKEICRMVGKNEAFFMAGSIEKLNYMEGQFKHTTVLIEKSDWELKQCLSALFDRIINLGDISSYDEQYMLEKGIISNIKPTMMVIDHLTVEERRHLNELHKIFENPMIKVILKKIYVISLIPVFSEVRDGAANYGCALLDKDKNIIKRKTTELAASEYYKQRGMPLFCSICRCHLSTQVFMDLDVPEKYYLWAYQIAKDWSAALQYYSDGASEMAQGVFEEIKVTLIDLMINHTRPVVGIAEYSNFD